MEAIYTVFSGTRHLTLRSENSPEIRIRPRLRLLPDLEPGTRIRVNNLSGVLSEGREGGSEGCAAVLRWPLRRDQFEVVERGRFWDDVEAEKTVSVDEYQAMQPEKRHPPLLVRGTVVGSTGAIEGEGGHIQVVTLRGGLHCVLLDHHNPYIQPGATVRLLSVGRKKWKGKGCSSVCKVCKSRVDQWDFSDYETVRDTNDYSVVTTDNNRYFVYYNPNLYENDDDLYVANHIVTGGGHKVLPQTNGGWGGRSRNWEGTVADLIWKGEYGWKDGCVNVPLLDKHRDFFLEYFGCMEGKQRGVYKEGAARRPFFTPAEILGMVLEDKKKTLKDVVEGGVIRGVVEGGWDCKKDVVRVLNGKGSRDSGSETTNVKELRYCFMCIAKLPEGMRGNRKVVTLKKDWCVVLGLGRNVFIGGVGVIEESQAKDAEDGVCAGVNEVDKVRAEVDVVADGGDASCRVCGLEEIFAAPAEGVATTAKKIVRGCVESFQTTVHDDSATLAVLNLTREEGGVPIVQGLLEWKGDHDEFKKDVWEEHIKKVIEDVEESYPAELTVQDPTTSEACDAKEAEDFHLGDSCPIFVGGIKHLQEEDLLQYFGQFGACKVEFHAGKGYCKAYFRDSDVADWVMKIQRCHNKSVKERSSFKASPIRSSYGDEVVDWTCALCCNFNFKSKAVCNRSGCDQTRAANYLSHPDFSTADWTCNLCGTKNFRSKKTCYAYECERTQADNWKEDRENRKPTYKTRISNFVRKDWICKKCMTNNFASRSICYMSGCDQTQEQNQNDDDGNGVDEDEDDDDTDDDGGHFGKVPQGGHSIENKFGNVLVEAKYTENVEWRKRRSERKRKRNAGANKRKRGEERDCGKDASTFRLMKEQVNLVEAFWQTARRGGPELGNIWFGGSVVEFVFGGEVAFDDEDGPRFRLELDDVKKVYVGKERGLAVDGVGRMVGELVGLGREGLTKVWFKDIYMNMIKNNGSCMPGKVVEARCSLSNVEAVSCRIRCAKCGDFLKGDRRTTEQQNEVRT